MEFITVSKHPVVDGFEDTNDFGFLRQYDLIINVSDHLDQELASWLVAHRIEHYWLPFGESYGMPLENIFAAMLILFRAEQAGRRVLVHCMAGRNRSRMIRDCYRYMTTGKYDPDSAMMLNVNDSQLPGIYRLELFLQKCLEVLEDPGIAESALIDWIKKETFGF